LAPNVGRRGRSHYELCNHPATACSGSKTPGTARPPEVQAHLDGVPPLPREESGRPALVHVEQQKTWRFAAGWAEFPAARRISPKNKLIGKADGDRPPARNGAATRRTGSLNRGKAATQPVIRRISDDAGASSAGIPFPLARGLDGGREMAGSGSHLLFGLAWGGPCVIAAVPSGLEKKKKIFAPGHHGPPGQPRQGTNLSWPAAPKGQPGGKRVSRPLEGDRFGR